MLHRVKDLSPQQRLAIEALIGRGLLDDEGLNIQPARILKDAPTGKEREEAFAALKAAADTIGNRGNDIADDELETAIRDACNHARHS